MKRLPSVKTLETVFGEKAREARRILEMTRAQLEDLPAGAERVKECYHLPKTYDVRLHCLDALGKTCGIEGFWTARKGYCTYLNTGDTYSPTIMWFDGRYQVASWGDVAERHGSK